MITLGSITLNQKMVWNDEFDNSSMEYLDAFTISGKMVRQQGLKTGGRPITLAGGVAQRALIVQLRVLQESAVFSTLTLNDGRTFLTSFIDNSSIVATPVGGYHMPIDEDYYELELKLAEVLV